MTELIHTAGVMSKAEEAPREARTAAMVEGMSWMELVRRFRAKPCHPPGRPDPRRCGGVSQPQKICAYILAQGIHGLPVLRGAGKQAAKERTERF